MTLLAPFCPVCKLSLVFKHHEKHRYSSLDIFECVDCGYAHLEIKVGVWKLVMALSPAEFYTLTQTKVLCLKRQN